MGRSQSPEERASKITSRWSGEFKIYYFVSVLFVIAQPGRSAAYVLGDGNGLRFIGEMNKKSSTKISKI